MIYLDNAATSFIKPLSVHRAVSSALLTASSPGRGAHQNALKAAEIVYSCREAAASLFHMDDPSRVVFTSNATHALNIAILTLARKGSHVLISGFEHNAVTRPLFAVGAEVQIVGRSLFDAQAMLDAFRENIGRADLVVCTHVSNVFGFVLPIDKIAALCREHHVPLIIDASQSAGIQELDFSRLHADYIAMPGHKALFGPQGTGLLLCAREGIPLLFGGTGADSASPTMPELLPERLEAGTMNVPGIAGLLAGIRYVQDVGTETIRAHEQKLLNLLTDSLEDLPKLKLFASPGKEQSGILSFTVDGIDSESFCNSLSNRGIAARGGLHCAPTAHQSAGTLETGTVRLSLSPFVDEAQILYASRVIRNLI